MYDVVQLKMTNGSEVVCEVLEWPDQNDNQIIARNALSIVNYEIEDGERVYMFVPWIHFNEGPKDLIIINADHIIATGKPTQYLIDQYRVAVTETNMANKRREEEHLKRKEEGLKQIEQAIDRVLKPKETSDKPANVVIFPGKNDDTVH
jgi:ribosomal protein L13